MLTPDGPKVLEYNVRFGDPECQVVVPRLGDDLARHCLESARGRLGCHPSRSAPTRASPSCSRARAIPRRPRTGDVIEGLDAANALPGVTVFHAGTARRDDGAIVTAGGRVLDVTALGADARRGP